MVEQTNMTLDQTDLHYRIAAFVARQVVKKRHLVLIFMVCMTIFWLYHCTHVKIYTYLPDLLPQHPYTDLARKYPFGAINRVLLEIRVKEGDIFNRNTLQKIINISDDMIFIEGMDRNKVISIGVRKIKNIKATSWGLSVPSLMFPSPPQDDEEMEELKSNIYSNSMYFGQLVSLDSKAALIIGEFFEKGVDYKLAYRKLEEIKTKYTDQNNEIYITGNPYLYGIISHYIGQTFKIFIISGIIMLLLAAVYTRHIRLTLLPLASAVVASIWGIGFVGLVGFNLDPIILVVPLLISARAISHSIQHNWRINEEYAKSMDMEIACENTIKALFYPGMAGIVTDAMGILLVAYIRIPIMQKLGIICFCWAMSMLFVVLIQDTIFYLYLPLMKDIDSWYKKKRSGIMEKVMGVIALSGKGRGRYIILGIVTTMVLVSGYFTSKLEVGDIFPGTPILRPASTYNVACNVMDRDFPGLMDPLLIVARCDGERGISTARLMEKLSEFQFYLMQNPLVKRTVSIADLIKTANMKLMEDDPQCYVLPDTDLSIGAHLLGLMGGGAEPDDFDQYYTQDYGAANLVAFCQDHTTRTVTEIIRYCKDYISRITDKDIHFDLASGVVGIVAAVNEAVSKDQVLISIAAFVVVFVFCSMFFQSFVAAFLLILPLGVANLFVFGYMGLAHIGLSLQTLPVSTIAVGIGVDYGIYLLSRIREETIRFQDLEAGIIEAVRTAGNAITITALIVIAGVVFWFMSDIKFQSDMGFFLSLVTFFHLLGTLFFLPTLVYLARPSFILRKING
ncbi:Conserved uncharacterized membrane protein [uncultured Desulfobacterium sp.]|uniref:Conserved uncharacterized membrane protein n=1 Tax=uncultured Desulfobacterium sp. TaxID=201089 RepID=A0A445MYD1_9BACT|nr:Conserved uncharacterized membrane protein [uncultured Desulfobacterium sp.]